VRTPDLHIGGVGGVARVDLVEHQKPAVVPGDHFLAQAAQAIHPDGVQIGRRLGVFHSAVLAHLAGPIESVSGIDGVGFRHGRSP
jgi:hypothetical protein